MSYGIYSLSMLPIYTDEDYEDYEDLIECPYCDYDDECDCEAGNKEEDFVTNIIMSSFCIKYKEVPDDAQLYGLEVLQECHKNITNLKCEHACILVYRRYNKLARDYIYYTVQKKFKKSSIIRMIHSLDGTQAVPEHFYREEKEKDENKDKNGTLLFNNLIINDYFIK